MSATDEIIDKIIRLAQGKLSGEEKEETLRQIAESPGLAEEYDFWRGIYTIRDRLPHYDFTAHPSPEALDRFAQARISQLSTEYSELAMHLQQCPACTEDVELLRQAVRYLPEDKVEVVRSTAPSFFSKLLTGSAFAKVMSGVAAVLIVAVGAVLLLQSRDEALSVRVALQPQFERRAIVDERMIPEMAVTLKRETKELIFEFPTDRVEVPDYWYEIRIVPRGGEPLTVEGEKLECRQSQFHNQCELTVDNVQLLSTLKQGGSFSLMIREEFPSSIELEPAEYEYFFRVTLAE